MFYFVFFLHENAILLGLEFLAGGDLEGHVTMATRFAEDTARYLQTNYRSASQDSIFPIFLFIPTSYRHNCCGRCEFQEVIVNMIEL